MERSFPGLWACQSSATWTTTAPVPYVRLIIASRLPSCFRYAIYLPCPSCIVVEATAAEQRVLLAAWPAAVPERSPLRGQSICGVE